MALKLTWIVQILLAFYTCHSLAFQHVLPRGINDKPTRVLGNVSVIDTPLVRAAQSLALQHSSPYLYNHIIRTWLFGALVISHNTTLQSTVDLEVHALASMLHDLGLVLNASWITPDRRFEVDSGFAATGFVEDQLKLEPGEGEDGGEWDANRLQLLWDAIVFSSESKFSLWKQDTVATVMKGVLVDLARTGVDYNVTNEEYEGVVAAFPYLDFLTGVNDTFIELCVQKPGTTYDSWQQAFGDAFVPGYSAVGNRILDVFK